MIITSTNNEKIKFIKKVKDDKNYLFLDSPKLIEEAIKSSFEIKYFVTEENKQDKFKDIFEYVNKCQSEIIEVSERVFKTLSNTVWSQGIIGITLKKENKFAFPKGNYLVLDEFHRNLETLNTCLFGPWFWF
jgi:TrmH family RNA methyltransferase